MYLDADMAIVQLFVDLHLYSIVFHEAANFSYITISCQGIDRIVQTFYLATDGATCTHTPRHERISVDFVPDTEFCQKILSLEQINQYFILDD